MFPAQIQKMFQIPDDLFRRQTHPAVEKVKFMIHHQIIKGCSVDQNPDRQESARCTGICVVVVGNDEEGRNVIRTICGENGPDVVVEATGAHQVLVDALQIVRPGGRIVAAGVYHGTIQGFDPLPILSIHSNCFWHLQLC